MNGPRVLAALGAQHQSGLAGEGAEGDLAVEVRRNGAGERRLAGAGIAEQPEHLRFTALQPAADLPEGVVLLR